MTYKRTKSRLFLYGLLATVVLVALIATLVRLKPQSSISRANYDKIQPGMAITEVEAIVGAPSDDLPPLSYQDIHADESALRTYPPPHELRFWKDNTHMITVILDSQGRVAGKSYSRRPDISVVRRIIDWLGL
jgi:hypothetical protein